MSYKNPSIPIITNPVGIDAVIQNIQLSLSSGLIWLEKSFGRAWTHVEKQPDGKTIKLPKCYSGTGEYINVLPNDNLKAQSFIAVRDKEKTDGHINSSSLGIHKKRDISLYIWGNLKKINVNKTYIFTEELKREVEKILIGLEYIQSLNGYYDERAEVVFVDYTLNDVDTQYLMHPYFAMRFDITVSYFDSIC